MTAYNTAAVDAQLNGVGQATSLQSKPERRLQGLKEHIMPHVAAFHGKS